MYPPAHNAGAEVMLHTLFRDLVRRGWEAHVLATMYRGEPYTVDGVTVEKAPADVDLLDSMAWCDVLVTHLDATRQAVAWAKHGRPLVHLVHNHVQLERRRIRERDASLVVWNSCWVRDHEVNAGWSGRAIVVRPPVLSGDYRTDRTADADRTTLLNLYGPKGADVFWELARTRPGDRFLGVLGAYGRQVVPKDPPANAEVLEHTPEVLEVYRRTRVLLVPSDYESWGRVAVEALASGIPVVASPTPGLREALTLASGEPAALFAARDQPGEWHDALDRLADPQTYAWWQSRSLARSAELDRQAAADLDLFADEMLRLAHLLQKDHADAV